MTNIEDIMMEAYAYGIQEEVRMTAKKLIELDPHDTVKAFETAFWEHYPNK